MMFRVAAQVSLPLALAASLCFSGVAQTTSAAPANPVPVQTAPTKPDLTGMSSSGSLANSNEVASLYGAPVVQIVARVNDRVITNADITRAQTQLDQDAHQNSWTLEEYNHNEKNLLRDLIDQQLLLSKGKQLGITGDTELIKRLDDIRKQNHLDSLEDLEKAVEQQGISYEDFKANIRNSIVTQQVVRDEVGSKMQISQAEIEKYYKEHAADFTQQESVHLNEILIPTSEGASAKELAAANAKAKEIEGKLKAGSNFADLAKKYSGGPTASEGGDLGQFKRGALAKVLEDQTFSLPAGGYTAPIRTKQGYIILQVSEHTPGGAEPLQKAEPQIEQALYMEKIQPAVREYLTKLRDQAYIDIRPGYIDSASSPNETKPTFASATVPQPKKKKKKSRFDRRQVRYAQVRGRTKKVPAAATTAATATAATVAGAATAATAGSSAAASTTQVASSSKKSLFKRQTKKKNQRVKLRYGQAPAAKVSDEQVATAAGASQATGASTADADASGATDVQPLGADLEHAPTITQPAKVKTRFSDQARVKPVIAVKTKHKRGVKKAKKKKTDNALSSPLSSTEVANQKVQDAPLGLEGATAAKKKKKKAVRVKGEAKTRMSDEKKGDKKKVPTGASTPPADDTTPASHPNQYSTPLPPPNQPS